ncbi:MAG: type VI secretion system protein TssL [Gammaproteobacteria bacterium]|nr:MAG: type VI secretion system protein TssL [Gammaproteobacteria bacterium]
MSDNTEEQECPECPAGLPAYLATFADLMSLLMCFFVLLLAFSEMDVKKYKQVAGSMQSAFGVQNQVQAQDIPKGTSIIAQEFSPGRPDPTPLNVVQQQTTDMTKSTLQVECVDGTEEAQESDAEQSKAEAVAKMMQKLVAQTQADAVDAAQSLKTEIENGKIEVETQGRKIIIRVKEQGSFASGSATLRPGFMPIMDKIRDALKDMPGTFAVTGHTDDVPISTRRFRSNWELSSSRSVSVAHELMKTGEMDPTLFSIVGLGETQPLVPNDTVENRARNRRVEIVVEQGGNDEAIMSGEEELPEDDEFTLDMIKEAGLEGLEGFEILNEDEDGNQETLQSDNGEQVISVLEPKPDELKSDDIEVNSLDVEVNTPRQVVEPELPRKQASEPAFEPRQDQSGFDISVDPFSNPAGDDEEFF